MKYFTTLALLACASLTMADGAKLKLTATAGLNFIDSATRTQSINIFGKAVLDQPGVQTFTFDGLLFNNKQTTSASNNLDTTANFWEAGGRYDKVLHGKLSYYLSTRHRIDRPANLDSRWLHGAGLAYTVHTDDTWHFVASAGGSYLTESYVDGSAKKNDAGVAMGTNYLRKVGKDITVEHVFSFIPKLSNTSDYLATSIFSLGFKLNDKYKLSLSNVSDYRSVAPVGTQRKNQQWVFGLNFSK